ncbi:MAG: hypothetical protein K2K98_06855 [Muribaculaceae bacterium]|nr:hypothetical protein [Muribaculaceae bacterium]MDE7421407.1 hypothetical protein [Muribaculaceae bacterium]
MTGTAQKIRPALLALAIGEVVTFPISRLKSVRTQASELGAIYERKFVTKMNREERTVEVHREK